ncbi:TadE/TadG family type IV pilus assembly protein [Novosphingobium sp. Leaf2]|uniref:TadE/TadG family type IV pilus assembly protein n=1 Tax=Novosphingobium sp. Leaf2 TaxID=1735670 RepID=UPI000700F7F2|nr:TadE/TadG family type IV pilus assembly protein [Novosphingobium sp. Leaf2]KQM19350.1 pilus assembly protein TadG [Novosphingobium sp. Leaf2]
MPNARPFLSRLLRDRAGNVLPIAAIGMMIGLVVIGSGVDMSRDYLTTEQLQSACDAAVLAGRRTVTTNGYDTAAQTAATNYFNTNFSNQAQSVRSTTFTTSSPDNGQTVNGTASTLLDTLIMRVFGKNTFTITATCTSSMGVGNSDVMMVLDNTGSMDTPLDGSTQTRIQALRAAMKNFYTTIANATAASNARIRYGFVPFTSTVNVGRLVTAIDPRYIVDSYTYQSRAYEADDSGSNDSASGWTLYSTKAYSNSSCGGNVPADTAFTDSGSGATKQQTMIDYACRSNFGTYYIYQRTITRPYIIRYHPVTYDTSSFKNFSAVNTPTGLYGANQSSTWGGCIQERATVAQSTFTYSATNGITPSSALDLDLDNAPNVSDNTTKWAPLWPDISYRRWNNSGNYTTATTTNGTLGGTYCPVAARQLATMSQSDFNAYADSLYSNGATYLDIGMIWGGRLMSPQGMWAPLVNTDPANGGEVARHIIFMTDGFMEPNSYIPQAWGMEYWDRRVTTDGSTNDAARHTQRFLATCQQIKAKGIRVWVIAFTSTLSSDLQNCASDSSSFTANSASDLDAAFQEIAKQVGELRVTQ